MSSGVSPGRADDQVDLGPDARAARHARGLDDLLGRQVLLEHVEHLLRAGFPAVVDAAAARAVHVLQQRVVDAVGARVRDPLELQAAAQDLVAHLVDALLPQREDLVDEQHHAGVVRLHDVLELVDDHLRRAHAEAAAGELLLAEDALEGAAARREHVGEASRG
jgi:hypothetical protein